MHFIFREMVMILSRELHCTSPCKTRRNKQKDTREHPLGLLALCEYTRVSFSTVS